MAVVCSAVGAVECLLRLWVSSWFHPMSRRDGRPAFGSAITAVSLRDSQANCHFDASLRRLARQARLQPTGGFNRAVNGVLIKD